MTLLVEKMQDKAGTFGHDSNILIGLKSPRFSVDGEIGNENELQPIS